ncbi:MAG: sigma-54 dependent transcriptional regulator [bacterium]
MRTILIVDDEKNIRLELSGLLADAGYATLVAESAEDGLARFDDDPADLVLLDVNLPGQNGLEALAQLRDRPAAPPVIMMSGEATVETAVRATKLGAFDYLEKPLDPDRLQVTVRNALENVALARKSRELAAQLGGPDGLVGDSPAMRKLRDAVGRAAASDARVLITGENGTGKELVARALHEGSARAKSPFGKVNCAAIPRELIESELFGHEKGSFTGATARKIGRIEAADGGTLLLDEVGDMALEAQAKLLRVLEEREVERVGSNRTIPVDVRVIAATNKDLPTAIRDGEFREDLYYRLNVIPIHVPPLRDRREDVDALVDHFRAKFQRESGRSLHALEPGARKELAAWSWPGNVRELRNVVERLEIMTDGDVIGAADVRSILAGSRPFVGTEDGPAAAEDENEDGLPLREILDRTERRLILAALGAANGTVSEAARQLGLDRANLHRKMRRLGIERADAEDADPVAEDVSD